ncbi:hypothetical protein SAMN05444678_1288 [Sphingomonas sp. YR710]|uniref:bifunctional aminoglycoside phosphotransferase/ATP-binding protein n=1 Tax=Sphingomonas sp. YR710 TaxID=1882773 RepID=UPI00088E5C5C|nr:AAA family ATPase [Sphingomonas sp. YR710]SDD86887.1 hypothetical protein SAMN05444678_1288 [Sphingomonas sp. YR710]
MATASPAAGTPDPQADVVAFLQRSDTFGALPKRVDTHAASVFLAGDRAWKLKRAINFGYLDFSTPDKRRDTLEAELRLNRRTAPDLYRALHRITRADGRLSIDGAGETIDWLLEMRRFPDDALLADKADHGQLDQQLLTRLADRIRSFHAAVDAISSATGAASFRHIVEGNIASMATFPEILDPGQAACLCRRQLQLIDERASLLDARAHAGRIRHVHGDLHLANIALIDGEPTLFDCLEFSVELATIDVLYDLAFLLMDLWHRNLRTEANIVFNRYLDLSPADESGIALMPLFLSVRATIRAHVLAAQSMRTNGERTIAQKARSYLDLALALLTPVPARLVAIGGLSGTGKSSVARRLAGDIGRPPGARIVRSDVLRKRLAGVPPETRLPKDGYSAAAALHVYAAANQAASAMLAYGQAAIIDAVFARRDQRDRIEAVARQAGVAFDGLWLEAAGGTRIARIERREADASDADATVAKAQSRIEIGDLGNWQTINADRSLAEVADEAEAKLEV